MPFQGTLPVGVRSILKEIIGGWGSPDVLNACSGNFTVERALRALPVRFHCCDVTLYTSALGSAFTGTPLAIRVKPERMDRWGFLAGYLDTPDRAAATILLLGDLYSIDESKLHIGRVIRGTIKEWPRLHERTLVRLSLARPNVASYSAADALEWLASMPADWPVWANPPYTEARGYEVMFPVIEGILDWDPPSFRKADAEWQADLLTEIRTRPHWGVILPNRPAELEDNLVGYVSRMTVADMYLYASSGPHRIEMAHNPGAPPPWPKIAPGDVPADPLVILPLSESHLNGLRAEYLNPMIGPAAPMAAFGVIAGGKLIGCYAVTDDQGPTRQTFAGQMGMPGPGLFLLSDFPVVAGKADRLAKLVLLAALSRESQLLIERVARHRVLSLWTVAYTERPVSMKYRGIFELVKRADGKRTRYELHYAARLGQWPLDEALGRWEAMK